MGGQHPQLFYDKEGYAAALLEACQTLKLPYAAPVWMRNRHLHLVSSNGATLGSTTADSSQSLPDPCSTQVVTANRSDSWQSSLANLAFSNLRIAYAAVNLRQTYVCIDLSIACGQQQLYLAPDTHISNLQAASMVASGLWKWRFVSTILQPPWLHLV